MGIYKDSETGNYILKAATAVQKQRLTRKKYVKQNLEARRSGLIAWVINLLSFGVDPFKISPIASHVAKSSRLIKNCKSARFIDEKVDSSHLIYLGVREGLHLHLIDAETEADNSTDPLEQALLQEEAFLDECRPEKIKTGLEVALQRELDGLESVFSPLAKRAAEDKIHLDKFRSKHELSKTFYWGELFSTGNLGLMMGIVIFEFLLNSVFFAAANPLGLVGGAALALVLSIATIVLGIALGVAYQFNHPNSEGGGWNGKVLFAIVFLASLFYLLLLTLARLAGESGELQLFKSAAKAIQENPFSGLLDLPSFGYFLFSIGVIVYTAFKYVTIMGRFPGLRRRVIHAEQSEVALDEEVSAAGEHFRTTAEAQIEALDSLPFFIQDTVLAIKDIEMNYENVVDQLKNDCQTIASASRLLLSYVRSSTSSADVEINSFADVECVQLQHRNEFKLATLREKVGKLVARDEIQAGAVDKCRKAMNDTLKEKLEILATACIDIKNTRFQEKLVEISDNPALAI